MINKLRIPQRLSISITPRCQSKCRMCHFWHSFDVNDCSQDLPLNIILQTIAHFDFLRSTSLYSKDKHRVNLTGGEPLLRFDDVLQIAAYCSRLHIPLVILTNGLAINKNNFEDLLKFNFYYLSLSVESNDEEENDACRGVRGHYKHVHTIIPMMKSFIQKHKLSTLIGTNTVITQMNYNKLMQISKHYKELGVDYTTTQFLDTHYPPGRALPENVSPEYRDMLTFAIENNIPRNCMNEILQSRGLPEVCGAKSFLHTSIYADGRIAPCSHIFSFPEVRNLLEGINIYKMSLLEYFDDVVFSRIENVLKVCRQEQCAGYHLPCYNF